MTWDAPSVTLRSGEVLRFPGGYEPREIALPGNFMQACDHLVFAYCPESGTGFAWCRYPAPHWQMIQPVTRAGFDDWMQQATRNLGMQVVLGLRAEFAGK